MAQGSRVQPPVSCRDQMRNFRYPEAHPTEKNVRRKTQKLSEKWIKTSPSQITIEIPSYQLIGSTLMYLSDINSIDFVFLYPVGSQPLIGTIPYGSDWNSQRLFVWRETKFILSILYRKYIIQKTLLTQLSLISWPILKNDLSLIEVFNFWFIFFLMLLKRQPLKFVFCT